MHRPPEEPDEIYCDETLARGPYDLMGGLWLTAANARRMRRAIEEVRRAHNFPYEFKWKKAAGTRLSGSYRDFAQKLTDQIWARRARFNCIAIQRRLVDMEKFHERDHELAYYKFMTLLIRKRVQPGRSFVVYLDHRTTRNADRLSDMKRVINAWAKADHGITYDCCRDVQAISSKTDDLLQATDVILGAVGFHYCDGHRDPNSSMGKNILAERIAHGIRRPHLHFASPLYEEPFNIWRWSPSK